MRRRLYRASVGTSPAALWNDVSGELGECHRCRPKHMGRLRPRHHSPGAQCWTTGRGSKRSRSSKPSRSILPITECRTTSAREPLDAFQRDVECVGLLRMPNIALNSMREVEDVLCSLDAGDQETFSSAWSRIMPTSYHEAANALQLRLQANFAIHGARLALQDGREPDAAKMQEDLKPFLAFLNERGSDEMSGDETLMPLFALPFVQRPHAHPDVREVFSPEWFQELRKDVEAALRLRQPIPRIYDILEHSSTENGKRSWQDFWATMSVWAELLRLADASLDAMVLLSQGSPAPPVLATARQQLELLREHIPRGLELQLKSHFERPGACPMSPARSRAATARPQLAHRIDFGALKRFLCASPQELCARREFGEVALPQVLRALLQRLASESPLPQRRGFLVAITCFDVLGVRDQPAALPALLEEVSELTLGILAVLACEAVGRSYIVSSGASVRRMVELLKSKPLDSSIHIQVLAAMQRLSLRRSAQDRMIEMGMVEWAIGVLSSQEEGASRAPSEFSLEFGSAMLMNLALRSTGKRKCLEQDVLPMAMKLMEHWNPQIRTHINGTLYSLLSLPEFRQSARREGLELALRSIHRQASSLGDEIAVRQILGTNTALRQELPPDEFLAMASILGRSYADSSRPDLRGVASRWRIRGSPVAASISPLSSSLEHAGEEQLRGRSRGPSQLSEEPARMRSRSRGQSRHEMPRSSGRADAASALRSWPAGATPGNRFATTASHTVPLTDVDSSLVMHVGGEAAYSLLPDRLGEYLGPACLSYCQERQDYEVSWGATETLAVYGRPLHSDRTTRLFLHDVDLEYAGFPDATRAPETPPMILEGMRHRARLQDQAGEALRQAAASGASGDGTARLQDQAGEALRQAAASGASGDGTPPLAFTPDGDVSDFMERYLYKGERGDSAWIVSSCKSGISPAWLPHAS
eukprot:s1773_g3.t2